MSASVRKATTIRSPHFVSFIFLFVRTSQSDPAQPLVSPFTILQVYSIFFTWLYSLSVFFLHLFSSFLACLHNSLYIYVSSSFVLILFTLLFQIVSALFSSSLVMIVAVFCSFSF